MTIIAQIEEDWHKVHHATPSNPITSLGESRIGALSSRRFPCAPRPQPPHHHVGVQLTNTQA